MLVEKQGLMQMSENQEKTQNATQDKTQDKPQDKLSASILEVAEAENEVFAEAEELMSRKDGNPNWTQVTGE